MSLGALADSLASLTPGWDGRGGRLQSFTDTPLALDTEHFRAVQRTRYNH